MTAIFAILGLASCSVIWVLIQRAGDRSGTPSCCMPGRCCCDRSGSETCPQTDAAQEEPSGDRPTSACCPNGFASTTANLPP